MTNTERIDYMLKSKEELIDIIDQYKDDMQRLKDGYYQFKIRNRSLESDNNKLKKEISALNAELEERKNKRSPRWPSDVMRICVLESKVDELTRENERLRYSQPWMYERSRYSQPWMYGMSSKEATNRIFGVNGTIHKLREENKKLKDALELCQKEASAAREHAHNAEVNAERIRLGID